MANIKLHKQKLGTYLQMTQSIIQLAHRFFFVLLLLVGLSVASLTASSAYALDCQASNLTPSEQVRCGVQATNPSAASADSEQSITNTISNVINILSIVVGIISVIVIIVQGLRLVLSGGNSQTVGEARNGIIYALIGLVIVALAQAIVFFVLDRAVG